MTDQAPFGGSLDLSSAGGGSGTATILSDLSANIFSALLLVLILLLQIRVEAGQGPAEARPVAIERSGAARPHRPLSRSGLLAMLKARGPQAGGLSLDVIDDGVRLPDETVVPPGPALDALLSRAPGGDAVRLYVFSNRAFAAVTAAVDRSRRSWTDLSVPRALRPSGAAQRWSPAFLDLVSVAQSDPAFRDGLARLLAASPDPLVRDGHVAGGSPSPSGSAASVPGGTTLANLTHMVGVAVAVSALVAGFVLVALVEARVGAPRSARAGADEVWRPARLPEAEE